MKIGEVFDLLNEAIETKNYLDDVSTMTDDITGMVHLRNDRVDEISTLLGKLVVLVKKCNIEQ